MRALKEKGYVMVTKRNFWVILPPWFQDPVEPVSVLTIDTIGLF
jgi:hypothetical protein